MRKLTYVFIALGLSLGACKKKESTPEPLNPEEYFVINGETFSVEETKKKLALILNLDEERFVYVPDSVAFTLRGSYGYMFIEPVIESIKKVKL